MNTRADKKQENKSRSVSNAESKMQNGGESTFQFVDNRPEAMAQRNLHEIANNSPQAMQLKPLQSKVNNSPQAKKIAQLQAMANNSSPQQQHPIQKKENDTGLPDNLKTGMENLTGIGLDDVKVHRNSDKPAQLQAHAYAQGTHIHLAPGQEQHLPHELGHVVQQKQGRVKPTTQLKEKVNINDDKGLEREADLLGEKAMLRNKPEEVSINNTSNSITSGSPFQLVKINLIPKSKSKFSSTRNKKDLKRISINTLISAYNDLQKRSDNEDSLRILEEMLTIIQDTPEYRKFRGRIIPEIEAEIGRVSEIIAGNQLVSLSENPSDTNEWECAIDESRTAISSGSSVAPDVLPGMVNIDGVLPRSFNEGDLIKYQSIMVALDKNWNLLKSHYKTAKKGQEPTPQVFTQETADEQMKSIKDYRYHITVNKDYPHSSMSKAKKRVTAEDPPVGREIQKPKEYLYWKSAGSDDPTSDIDLNIMGRKSEFASQYAFDFFRKQWGKESGEVFDVNFYARDWKPTNLFDGLGAANSAIDREHPNVDRSALRGAGFEGKGNRAEAKRLEKANSIAKLIRDMKNLPDPIKASVKQALGGDTDAKAAWDGGVKTVLDWDRRVARTMSEPISNPGEKRNSRAKSENLEYAKATTELAKCRANLIGVTDKTEKSRLEGELLAARLKAAFYGPEAYVTEAAFIHGVINKQIQSSTFKNKSDKEHKVNIELDKDELLQVVIENVGFAFHHTHEIAPDKDSETRSMGYSAVAKYVYRACNAIKHMEVTDFEKLSVKAKNTVLKKKGVEKRTKRISNKDVSGFLNEYSKVEIEVFLVDLLREANIENKKPPTSQPATP